MKVSLDQNIFNFIGSTLVSLGTIQKRVIKAIKDLEKLYDIESLSEEELLDIIANFYCLDFSPMKEGERLSRGILKKDDLTVSKVETSIIATFGINRGYLDATVYHETESDFDTEHIYSFEELLELVNNRKIVVVALTRNSWRTPEGVVKKEALTESYRLPTLDKIKPNNFCGYEDIMMPIIRKQIQASKVESDITSLIATLRLKLCTQKIELSSRQKSLRQQLIQAGGNLVECKSLQAELEDIAKLSREKVPKKP